MTLSASLSLSLSFHFLPRISRCTVTAVTAVTAVTDVTAVTAGLGRQVEQEGWTAPVETQDVRVWKYRQIVRRLYLANRKPGQSTETIPELDEKHARAERRCDFGTFHLRFKQ